MAYEPGDIAFILVSIALVWLMIPGIGYFYSGMAREKNALSLIMCCLISLVVVTVQVNFRQCVYVAIWYIENTSGSFGVTAWHSVITPVHLLETLIMHFSATFLTVLRLEATGSQSFYFVFIRACLQHWHQLSSLAPALNVDDCCLWSFSSLSGPPSYTTQSPAGLGIHRDG